MEWRKSSKSGPYSDNCVEIGMRNWRKSKRSSETGNCVEIADDDNSVFVRDTKNRDNGTLEFSKESFKSFVDSVKVGEFD